MAEISAYLFEKEKKPAYAARAKKVLLTFGDYRSAMPDWAAAKRADYADGVPVLADFFAAMKFISDLARSSTGSMEAVMVWPSLR